MHRNSALRLILCTMFESQQPNGFSSSDSPIANIFIQRQPNIDMRNIEIIDAKGNRRINRKAYYEYLYRYWGRKPKSTKTVRTSSNGSGGQSTIEHIPILQRFNSIYRKLSPEQQNMLRYKIWNDWTHRQIADEYRITIKQVEYIFQQIYKEFPKLDNFGF